RGRGYVEIVVVRILVVAHRWGGAPGRGRRLHHRGSVRRARGRVLAGGRDDVGDAVDDDGERRGPHAEQVAGVDHRLGDAPPVEEGAVARSQVADDRLVPVDADLAVLTGDGAHGDAEVGVGVAA